MNYTVPFSLKTDDVSEEGKFKGYGSTFGGEGDSYKDVIVEGAFKKTIKNGGRNGNGIAMLWQHDPHNPIGIWNEITENRKGLYVEGELVLDVQKAKEAYALMKKGAVRGLSIGWDLPRDSDGKATKGSYEFDEESGTRYLKEVDLWEISPVTFPANVGATISDVKGIHELENAHTPRELERVLREVFNLSNSEAKYVVKLARPSLREVENKESKIENAKIILDQLKKANTEMNVFYAIRGGN